MNVLDELDIFYRDFTGEKGYIGTTEKGNLIPYFAVKKSESPTVLIQYSIHAREYITTYLAIKQIKDFIKNGKAGYIFFIPAVNIDGIKICLSQDGSYKANGRGVDLNVNFDAKWGFGEKNAIKIGKENCIGKFPFSESETKALRDFTLLVKPQITISYHSKGEEIYWEFNQDKAERKRDLYLAKVVSSSVNYPLKECKNSCGGYKDWCIEKLKISAYTIEVGKDSLTHPIKKRYVNGIFDKNKNLINDLVDSVINGREIYFRSDKSCYKGEEKGRSSYRRSNS